jgi:hypothetical protein
VGVAYETDDDHDDDDSDYYSDEDGCDLVRSLFIDGLTQQLNGQLQTHHDYKNKTRAKHKTTKKIV